MADDPYSPYIEKCASRARLDQKKFADDVLKVYEIWMRANDKADAVLEHYGLTDLELGIALRVMTAADAMITEEEIEEIIE